MMNLQELQTIRYHELPIKLVVFSNDGYGAIRQTCKNYFNGIYAGCDPDTGVGMPSFKEIANAFGFRYIECRNCGELENSIDSFVAADGRVLLQIDQKLDDQITPRIMSKLREDGTFETPAFVDLSPFVSEDVQLKIDEMERRLKDAEYPAV